MNEALTRIRGASSFESLFPDAATLATRYRELAKEAHPDHGGDADAFARLAALYHEAQENAAKGWLGVGRVAFAGTDGVTRRVRYLTRYDCGLATAYHGDAVLTYVIPAHAADLAERGNRLIAGLRFPSARMEPDLRRQLPAKKAYFHTKDSVVLVGTKAPELVRLAELLAHVGGRLDVRHVAWVVSRCLSVCCYLRWAKLAHHDLSLNSLYVDPAKHGIALLGGWWHAVSFGDQLPRLLPGRAVNELPRRVREQKRATAACDLMLVRRLARELLGDPDGTRLRSDKDVPRALAAWATGAPAGENAIEDFENWQKVLADSFGARRFVELNVKASDIYKNEE